MNILCYSGHRLLISYGIVSIGKEVRPWQNPGGVLFPKGRLIGTYGKAKINLILHRNNEW